MQQFNNKKTHAPGSVAGNGSGSSMIEERRLKENEREVNDLKRTLAEDVDLRGVSLHHFEKSLGWLTGSIAAPSLPEPVSFLVEFPQDYPAKEPPRFFFPKNPGSKLLDNLTHAVHNVAVVYQKNKRKNPAGRCLEDCLVFIARALQNSTFFTASNAAISVDDRPPLVNVVGSNNSAALTMMMASITHPTSSTSLPAAATLTMPSSSVPAVPPSPFTTSSSYSDFLSTSWASQLQHQQQLHQPMMASTSRTHGESNSTSSSSGNHKSVNSSSAGGLGGGSTGDLTAPLLLTVRMFDDDEENEWLPHTIGATASFVNSTWGLPSGTKDDQSSPSMPMPASASHSRGESFIARPRCGVTFGGGNDLMAVFTTSSFVGLNASSGTFTAGTGMAYPVRPGRAATVPNSGTYTTTPVWDSDEEDGPLNSPLDDLMNSTNIKNQIREASQMSVLRPLFSPSRYSLSSNENFLVAQSPSARLAWKLLETCPENALFVEALRVVLDELKREKDIPTLAMLSARAALVHSRKSFPMDKREATGFRRVYSERLQRAGDFFSRCALDKIDARNASPSECSEWTYVPEIQCVLCRMSARSSVTFCSKCNHGGHGRCLSLWFSSDEDVCPSGCGCQCGISKNPS